MTAKDIHQLAINVHQCTQAELPSNAYAEARLLSEGMSKAEMEVLFLLLDGFIERHQALERTKAYLDAMEYEQKEISS